MLPGSWISCRLPAAPRPTRLPPTDAARAHSNLFEWKNERDDTTPTVELVTSPNNPDYELRTKRTAAPFTIYDHCYYWPRDRRVASNTLRCARLPPRGVPQSGDS